MGAGRLPRWVLPFAVVALLVGAATWWWTHPPDPAEALRSAWAPLVTVSRIPDPDLGAGVERWLLVDALGDTVRALWRPAGAPPGEAADPPAQTSATASGARWTVVILGGARTGDRAALVLPPRLPAHVLAVDWPWSGPRRMSAARFALALPAIHRALLRSPAALALGVDAASRQPEVDSTRIVLLGASLGVPSAVAALRLTGTPSGVALLHGAARLDLLLESELRRLHWPTWAARPAAALGYRMVRPLEPTLHSEVANRIPVLLVSAAADERLPGPCVAALHEALPGAQSVWLDGRHVRPDRGDMLEPLVREVVQWLERIDAP
jgi:hypothetical protein